MEGLNYENFIESAWVQYVIDESNSFFSIPDLRERKETFMRHAYSGEPPPFIGLGSMNYHLMRARFAYERIKILTSAVDK